METSHILLLVVSASISFGLGRVIVHLRKKSRGKKAEERKLIALRDRPAEIASQNKSKRKRQLLQQARHTSKR